MEKLYSAILFTFLLAVGISGFMCSKLPAPTPAIFESKNSVPVKEITLECLPDSSIDLVRNTGSIDRVFNECRHELLLIFDKDFGLSDDKTLRAFLSTIVAGNFSEYGHSSEIEYKYVSNSKYLNCGNTIFLFGYLYGDLASKNIRSIGFEGGEIGNHTQLLFYSNNRTFLLDPTVGIIAETNFNDLLRGVSVPPKKIKIFSIKEKNIEKYREKVYLAIRTGKYVPTDFMYMHESLAEHAQKGSSSYYFTPGGITFRKKLR